MASGPAALLDHLRKMHEFDLTSSLCLLSHITISMMNNCVDLMTTANHCEVLKYQGDCLYKNCEFKKAYAMYMKALRTYKSASKMKFQNFISLQQKVSDADIRYKIYLCCIALNNDEEALSILEDIPQKSREPKVHYAMAKLYRKMNMEKLAIANYKEVLKVCPLALDCAIELLHLGEHPNVVISLVNVYCQLDWLVPYIKAHGVKLNKDFKKAVSFLEALSKHTSLLGNPSILCDLATAYYSSGDSAGALERFKACHLQDSQWLSGMDLYAYLLCEDEQTDELSKLSSSLFSVSQQHPQPWVAMGYFAKLNREHMKAVYLAARAAELDATCVQALLLKGVCLRMVGETKIADTHFRQAMALAPKRLDCYSELVTCYIEEYRNNEALNVAKSALDSVGYTPDALVLCAKAFLHDSSYEQAIRMVDRALKMNSNHKRAIELRCSIALRQKKYDDAIKLLGKAIQSHGSSVFHTMLANCYYETSKYSDAVDHYNIALSLNSNNEEAKEKLDKIHITEQSSAIDSGQNEELRSQDSTDEGTINAVPWPHDEWF